MAAQSFSENSIDDNSFVFVEEMKCNYTWNIVNFKSSIRTCNDCVSSPIFGTIDDIKWKLQIFPKGYNQNYIGCYVFVYSSDIKVFIASCMVCLIDGEGKHTNVRIMQPMKYFQATRNGFNDFIGWSELDSLLNGDKLTIYCDISLNISGQGNLVQSHNLQKGSVLFDLGKLFDEMKFSDVTLVAGGREIRAHKVILITRSEVFAAMFAHDMQEQKLSRVDIIDCDHDVLIEMLRFMYTDRTNKLDQIAAELLVAADKYKLENLKWKCEVTLYRNLSVETAVDTLILADLYSIEWLKEQTIAFINSKNIEMVKTTESWKKITSTYPHLIAELFNNITMKMQEHLPTYTFNLLNIPRRSDP